MHSPTTRRTALLVIDLQLGLTHPTIHGPSRSTPALESNITALLSAARSYNNTSNPTHPIQMIHIHHHSRDPTSLLHPSYKIDWSPPPSPFYPQDLTGRPGTSPLPCAVPEAEELVLTKSVNSAFIGTPLEQILRDAKVQQVVVVGMTTEHCVSTTVRMAANLNVVGDPDGFGERGVVLVRDGCACFGMRREEGGWEVDAELVHRVEVECLRGEFCQVVTTDQVVKVLSG